MTPRGAVPNLRDVDTRRAWFESHLTLPYDVHVAFKYDFNSAATPIKDAAVIYKGMPNAVVSVGNTKRGKF